MADIEEKVAELINAYYTPVDEELSEFRLINESDEIPLIMRETENALRLILDLLKPKRILEIGTAEGYSSLFFTKLLPEAHVTTIERNPYMIDKARAAFSTHSEGNRIKLITGDALEALESLRDEAVKSGHTNDFDFVFIDAAKSHYLEFLELALEITTNDAYIVCDNIMLKRWLADGAEKGARRHRTNIKYMRRFLDHINDRADLDISILGCGDGLAVIRRK